MATRLKGASAVIDGIRIDSPFTITIIAPRRSPDPYINRLGSWDLTMTEIAHGTKLPIFADEPVSVVAHIDEPGRATLVGRAYFTELTTMRENGPHTMSLVGTRLPEVEPA